jgi:DNA-binding Lrp family transcriptional regulator
MDPLDIRLLRAMFRGGVFTLLGVEPQLSLQELARRTGVSRITVRRRLRTWRESGFLRQLAVFPNPDLLGTSFQMQAVLFDPGRDRATLEQAVGEVLEPAFSFHVQDFACPVLLSEAPEISTLRQRALANRNGIHVLSPPLEIEFAASRIRLRPLDWAILQALRKSPELDWVAIARDLGITVRGLERRVRRLMDADAIFFFPELDFRRSECTVAWMGVLLSAGVNAQRVRAELLKRYPDLLFVENIFPIRVFLPPKIQKQVADVIPMLLPVASASTGEQLRRDVTTVPGALDAIVGFPTQNTSRPGAWDGRIERASRSGSREEVRVTFHRPRKIRSERQV